MGVSFEKDPDYLMFEPENLHGETQSNVPVAVAGINANINANGNSHVLLDLSDYFRATSDHPTLNDPVNTNTEPSQIQKHIQAIDSHNQHLYKPVIASDENNGAGLGNVVAVGANDRDNITVKSASALVQIPSPIAVDVANHSNSNEVAEGQEKIIYSPHDVFRKPEHFETLPTQLADNNNKENDVNANVQPVPQFLSPSELSYLPPNWIRDAGSGAGNENNDDEHDNEARELLQTRSPISGNNGELQKVPGIAGIAGTPYVGSSFLQADDVMVVEPVLHKAGNISGGAESDSSWQRVALALPTTSAGNMNIPVNMNMSMAVSMKNKRSRVARVGRFACPECHVVFRQTGNLRKHVAEIHQKSKPFRCNVCGNYFSRKHARDTHLKAVHHKLRPFECTLCFKRYKNRSDLNKHMRTVERKEKPHACPICNRAFGERGKLKRHMTIHEKRDPTLNSPAVVLPPPAQDNNPNTNENDNSRNGNIDIDTSNNNTC